MTNLLGFPRSSVVSATIAAITAPTKPTPMTTTTSLPSARAAAASFSSRPNSAAYSFFSGSGNCSPAGLVEYSGMGRLTTASVPPASMICSCRPFHGCPPPGLLAAEVAMDSLNYDEFVRALEADARTLVRVERPRPHTALVRLDDPGNQNALSGALTVQLRRALTGALSDPAVRAVVLTGSDPFFSVGGDWKLMRDRAHTAEGRDEGSVGVWKWIRHQFGGIARLIAQSDTPVVVAVNGAVAGVALAWTLASD